MSHIFSFALLRMFKKAIVLGLTTSLAAHASTALAHLDGENLIQPLPEHFKIAYRDGNQRMSLTEMVPKDETVDDWSTMVTTQIYYGARDASFDVYRKTMAQHWKDSCDDTDSASVKEGEENGYTFQLWVQGCHYNDGKRKPEITWFKMIKGHDSAYVVQVAFHHEPSKDEIVQWMKYLGRVGVCDSRLKGQECIREAKP